MGPWGLAILGLVLLVLGLLLHIYLLWIVGVVCLIVGVIWGIATMSRGPRAPL